MPNTRFFVALSAAILLCVGLAALPGDEHVQEKPVVKRPGDLIEVISASTGSISWVVIEPRDLDFRVYESGKIFVTAGVGKSGPAKVVRVLQITVGSGTDGKPSLTHKWHEWLIELPAPPPLVVLPTAKVTAEPTVIKAVNDPVVIKWETANAQKVELDGKEVEPSGSAMFRQQLPTAIYTIRASSGEHSIYAQAVVSIGEKPPPGPVPTKVTRVTYVYEKTTTAIPRQVGAALTKISSDPSLGIIANDFEVDTVAGSGQIPGQFAVAHKAAKEAGLPCLVVQSGDTVLRVVKSPKTEADVLNAIK